VKQITTRWVGIGAQHYAVDEELHPSTIDSKIGEFAGL
jgi:hypothetical protein